MDARATGNRRADGFAVLIARPGRGQFTVTGPAPRMARRVPERFPTGRNRHLARRQLRNTMQAPPAARRRAQNASASARVSRPIWAMCSRRGIPGPRA